MLFLYGKFSLKNKNTPADCYKNEWLQRLIIKKDEVMLDKHSNDKTIHIDISFTELFHLLKEFIVFEKNTSISDVSKRITLLMLHAENTTIGILHGLQAVGALAANSELSNKSDIAHLGHFLTLIANLLEALSILRSDCEVLLSTNSEYSEVLKIN